MKKYTLVLSFFAFILGTFISNPGFVSAAGTPRINSVTSPISVGEKMSINGVNLNSVNDFGKVYIDNVLTTALVDGSKNGKVLFFILPNLKVGSHSLYVRTSSRMKSNVVKFKVTKSSLPSITSFTSTKIDSDGWYYKLAWTTSGTNQVMLGVYPSVGGVSFTSDTGQDLSISNTFPSPGSINVRLTNGYSYPTRASFIIDPLPLSPVESFRKTVTIDVPAGMGPVASSFSPTSGISGDRITIYGDNFLPTGNDVAFVKEPGEPEFDINNLSSSDGKTLSFIIPSSTLVTGEDGITRTVYVTPGQYYFVVQNSNGKSSVLSGFNITAPQSSITVLSPNGGEVWNTGSTVTINWNTGNDPSISNVHFELRTTSPQGPAGVTGMDLYLGAPNTGTLTFLLPPNYPTGEYYLQIRKIDETLLDESDSYFTITSQ